jgi:hypothetical protein
MSCSAPWPSLPNRDSKFSFAFDRRFKRQVSWAMLMSQQMSQFTLIPGIDQ